MSPSFSGQTPGVADAVGPVEVVCSVGDSEDVSSVVLSLTSSVVLDVSDEVELVVLPKISTHVCSVEVEVEVDGGRDVSSVSNVVDDSGVTGSYDVDVELLVVITFVMVCVTYTVVTPEEISLVTTEVAKPRSVLVWYN